MHLPQIIQDLAVILMAAGAMTLLFRAIGQPVVLGYIVAGFLVGPHFEWMPTVIDTKGITVWAEIGVIFLLFALGLEFSFKKLVRVGVPASITAFSEVAGMIAIGFLVGQFFGWSHMDSLFLGGILAISSTTIIIRAFDELEMKTKGFVSLVFGVLIVEDLVAILLMVMLSTVAVSQAFSGVEMGVAALKLAFFLTLWFVLGIFLIPSMLKKFRKHLKDETLLILSLGLCFFMVVFATNVGFSPALGAFIMGSILAETLEAERIEHIVLPIKSLFGAIFFVSVGMLVDPHILKEYAVPIFVITLATIFGKLITTSLGALLAGQGLRQSVQAGMSLAQIGEFSFIIAGLGLSLNITSDFLYPIAISVSALTTFTTPYLIKLSDPAVDSLEKHLPPQIIRGLEMFRAVSVTASHTSEWRNLLKHVAIKIIANTVIVTAIFLIADQYFRPWLATKGLESAKGITLLVAILLSAPFLWAIVGSHRKAMENPIVLSDACVFNIHYALVLFRWIFGLIFLITLSSSIVSPGIIVVATAVFVLVTIYLLSRYFGHIYHWLERHFVLNLGEKDLSLKQKAIPVLAPWDSHLAELKVSPDSKLVGQKLSHLMVREHYGVTIVMIERGSQIISAPNSDSFLYPGDTLRLIGSDDQISQFRKVCEMTLESSSEVKNVNYSLQPIFVEASANYANKSIRDSGLRELTKGLIVGIEKGGQRKLNPDSSTLIEPGDILWIVGVQDALSEL